MFLFDLRGELVYANAAALELTGFDKTEDLREMNLFTSLIVPFEKDRLLDDSLIKIQTRIDSESMINPEYNPQAETEYIEGTVLVIDSAFLGQCQHNTLKKQYEELIASEEKYRRFFEDDLTGDFIATPEGKIMECNTAFAEIYGFSNCEEAVQTDISQFNPQDWKKLMESLQVEHKIRGHQALHQRPDGKQIHVISNVVAIFDESQNIIQVKGYIFDDTERKRAEDALRESEEKYRLLFDEDLTGNFIATPEGIVLECNPAFAEIHGFSNAQEVLGINISHFNQKDWSNLIGQLETQLKVEGYQSWLTRADGEKIHVVANVIGIFDDLNQLIKVKGYLYDDTERKRAEEDLIYSEEKYHLLFEEDLTGDFIATPEGNILECNPAFAEIYGFNSIENALKWNISQSNPFDWPYMITRLKNEGKILGFQSWQRRSDAMKIHVVANLVGIFNDSGELETVKGYVFDDTERKLAEDELERGRSKITRILDSIQDGFVAFNNLWDIIYVNPCASEYVRIDGDELLGQNLWQRFPELKGTIHEEKFRSAMYNHKVQHFETQGIINKDKWFDFSVYPSEDGISVYWRDITKRRSLEGDFKQKRKIRKSTS